LTAGDRTRYSTNQPLSQLLNEKNEKWPSTT
jgi:hypothetical protein